MSFRVALEKSRVVKSPQGPGYVAVVYDQRGCDLLLHLGQTRFQSRVPFFTCRSSARRSASKACR